MSASAASFFAMRLLSLADPSLTVQNAIDWLDRNADKSIDELKASDSASATISTKNSTEDGAPALKPGEVAQSLKCNDCGKQFRSTAQAEFHASRTDHQDFSESTEEIAPLTEEQKAQKIEELKKRRDLKRAEQNEADKVANRRNEEIRKKSTKEQQEAKEELARKEQYKDAAKKRKEKQDDIDAKKRIQAKIAEDKAERKRKADIEKAAREGRPAAASAEPPPATTPAAPKPVAAYTESRLRLQTPNGTMQKTFPVQTTLFEVAQAAAEEKGVQVQQLVQTFPKKVFDEADFGLTLKEAGLVPSSSLLTK